VQVGDLIRWKKTGKICVYLGLHDVMQRFYSDEYGIIERWIDGLSLKSLMDVVSESR